MLSLAPLDWLVIALFGAGVLALGFSARLRESSVLQYLAAGRQLSLPAFVATLVSTWYGGILGVGETVSYYGVGAWLLIGVPYYAFALLYALVFARRVRTAEHLSLPERLASSWGRGVGVLAGVLIFLLAVPAAHVLMLGSMLQQLAGLELTWAVGISAAVGLALLYRGGLLADVRVSLLAFAMMYIGFAAMVVTCVWNYPPAQTLGAIEPASLRTITGGASWTTVLSFFILGAWTIVDPAFHQRVASAATPGIGRRGVLVSVAFWLLFDVLSITAALYALALLDPFPAKLAVYPALAQEVLPPGLKALFLCGILGTVASAMVGYTLVSGATLGREIVARLAGESSERRVQAWIRAGLVMAMLVAIPVALTVRSVVDLWYSWAGAVVGAMLIPVSLSYVGRRSRLGGAWVFASMAIAATGALGLMAHGIRTNNLFLEVVCMRIEGHWRVMFGPVPPEVGERASQVIGFSLGTLLPGLVISGAILTLGALLGGKRHDGQHPHGLDD